MLEHNFLISSQNYKNIDSKIIGYAFSEKGLLTCYDKDIPSNSEGLSGPIVIINKQGNAMRIYRDEMGLVPLFLYEEKDDWALGNSIWDVIEYARKKSKVHLNVGYAESLYNCGTYNKMYEATICQEVRCIARFSEIIVDLANGQLKELIKDNISERYSLDSAEGMQLVDKTIAKWANIIQSVDRAGYSIQVDLSGGFDSRISYAITKSAGININNEKNFVFSVKPISEGLKKHFDGDYEIASIIARLHGITLSSKASARGARLLSLRNRYNNFRHTMYGFNTQAFDRRMGYSNPIIKITGFTGESIRIETPLEGILYNTAVSTDDYLDLIEMPNGCDAIIRDFNGFIRKLESSGIYDTNLERGIFVGNDDMFFGAQMLEYYRTGTIVLSPLIDIAWRRLKVAEGTDKKLIYSVILARTYPELLDIPVLHGLFSEEIKEEARKICEKYPLSDSNVSEKAPIKSAAESVIHMNFNENDFDVDDERSLNDILKEQFVNPRVEHLLEKKWGGKGKKLYQIALDRFNSNDIFHEETFAVACLAIAEVLEAEEETNGKIERVSENTEEIFSNLEKDFPKNKTIRILKNRYLTVKALNKLLINGAGADNYIYGAGKYGRYLEGWLSNKGIMIKAFLQTNVGEAEQANGYPILQSKSLLYTPDTIVFVAVGNEAEREKIYNILISQGLPGEAIIDCAELVYRELKNDNEKKK